MKSMLVFLVGLSFHFAAGQEKQGVKDFIKSYHAVIDPSHALDSAKSITVEMRSITTSVLKSVYIEQRWIKHISINAHDDFELELKPEGWVETTIEQDSSVIGLAKIRAYAFVLDTTDIEKISLKISNDSTTVLEKPVAKGTHTFTFDTKKKVLIRENISNTQVFHTNHRWYSDLFLNSITTVKFGRSSMALSQEVLNFHLNLTRTQAMLLKNN